MPIAYIWPFGLSIHKKIKVYVNVRHPTAKNPDDKVFCQITLSADVLLV